MYFWPVVALCIVYFWMGIGVSVFTDYFHKYRQQSPAPRLFIIVLWPIILFFIAFMNE